MTTDHMTFQFKKMFSFFQVIFQANVPNSHWIQFLYSENFPVIFYHVLVNCVYFVFGQGFEYITLSFEIFFSQFFFWHLGKT